MLFAKQSWGFAEAPSFAASVSDSTLYFIPKDFDRPLVGDSINTPLSCIFDGHNETLHKISLFSSFSAQKGKSSISAVYANMNIIIAGFI